VLSSVAAAVAKRAPTEGSAVAGMNHNKLYKAVHDKATTAQWMLKQGGRYTIRPELKLEDVDFNSDSSKDMCQAELTWLKLQADESLQLEDIIKCYEKAGEEKWSAIPKCSLTEEDNERMKIAMVENTTHCENALRLGEQLVQRKGHGAEETDHIISSGLQKSILAKRVDTTNAATSNKRTKISTDSATDAIMECRILNCTKPGLKSTERCCLRSICKKLFYCSKHKMHSAHAGKAKKKYNQKRYCPPSAASALLSLNDLSSDEEVENNEAVELILKEGGTIECRVIECNRPGLAPADKRCNGDSCNSSFFCEFHRKHGNHRSQMMRKGDQQRYVPPEIPLPKDTYPPNDTEQSSEDDNAESEEEEQEGIMFHNVVSILYKFCFLY
jgi:hypothetical protein